ncbi:unnamed protein product [Paramecium pentaurelia]|uniref:Uncharacterized protein n=1 Tax=Paramecium pentaurelia TaxID=43138 RepID=A0A8S1WCV2_9CILI|nr:unnamed protein product [Paramecium pentaurelia]
MQTILFIKQLIINSHNIENQFGIMQSLSHSSNIINLIDYMILDTISENKHNENQQFAYLLMEKEEQKLEQYFNKRANCIKYWNNQQINLDTLTKEQRDIKFVNFLIMKHMMSNAVLKFKLFKPVQTESYLDTELLNFETHRLKYKPLKSKVQSLGLCFLYIVTIQLSQSRQLLSQSRNNIRLLKTLKNKYC